MPTTQPALDSFITRKAGHGFGAAPVFLASICTILGAVMFLRFGYATAHLGMLGALGLILLGHLVTFPTAMAIAEIATNRRVEGGGEYYIISRSFGPAIGGAIGISLYFSQAISVAFYMIAFAEAFRPVFAWVSSRYGFDPDPRLVSLPATFLLLLVILKKGASLGVKALWVVFGILMISLAMFFAGSGEVAARDALPLTDRVANPDPFVRVFAIVFPAFTGMTAGVGLSGDLKNPRKSIPLGVLSATAAGMLVYVAIVIKLGLNATPEELAADPLIMSRIAVWGPIIPIGLAAATISSAVGSILIAPRTLQALARDRVFPSVRLSALLARGRGPAHEPVNATLVSGVLALVFVALGSVDFVAQIISMFFMVTYGALSTVSFLEHFAGNPSYRPSFRTRWYVSLLGAVLCFLMMMQMQPFYAVLALLLMVGIYKGLRYTRRGERDLAAIFEGVMFQLTRRMQIALQRSSVAARIRDWRPSIVAVTRHSLDRLSHFDLLRWLCQRHGFGQMIQYVEGKLSPSSREFALEVEKKLIEQTEESRAGIFIETIISPSYTSALAQVVQLPGVSGLPNNTVLLEFPKGKADELAEVAAGARLVAPLGFNVLILRSSQYRFGYRRDIHIWLTRDDLDNAALEILLAYILVGHPDWQHAEITLFACFPAGAVEEETDKLSSLITEGRLPIPPQRITPVPCEDDAAMERYTAEYSSNADLVIMGVTRAELLADPPVALTAHPSLRDVLFVNANEKVTIS
jgi:amino acid transporter